MKTSSSYLLPALALLFTSAMSAASDAHEVWFIDQSNSYDSDGNGTLDSGGTLYILDGASLAGNAGSKARAQVIDLGGAIANWVRTQTTTSPVRPHYLTFNSTGTHAIVSFVATGHVLIMDAATRTPVFVVDVGLQSHAAVPLPDDSAILVANQNGKLVQRITTNYATNTFALDHAATLNLATGTTPSGALKQDDNVTQTGVRPDTAPILALPDATSRLAFVTLRGGGAFVIDARSTPLAIVAEYTVGTIEPAGLLSTQIGDRFYFNSGGGGGATLGHQSVLYTLPVSAFSATPILTPDTPAPLVIFDHQSLGEVDSHGLLGVKQGRYLWVADRAANSVIVVNPEFNFVANDIALEGDLSSDPTPDLFATAPAGNRVYVTLRGPNPLTGNNPEVHNAEGNTPGLGVIQVTHGGLSGELKSIFRISHPDGGGVERADPMVSPCGSDELIVSGSRDALKMAAPRTETRFLDCWRPLAAPTSQRIAMPQHIRAAPEDPASVSTYSSALTRLMDRPSFPSNPSRETIQENVSRSSATRQVLDLQQADDRRGRSSCVVVSSAELIDSRSMAHIALAVYLLLVGLNILVDLDLPSWILGTLAVVAGALMLLERFGFGIGARKK